MRKARGDGLVLALVFGLTLGAPVAPLVEEAAAQAPITFTGEECGIVLDFAGTTVCTRTDSERGTNGNVTSTGGNGNRRGNGGFSTVDDVGSAREETSCSVTVGDITSGDEGNNTVTVDAGSLTDSVSVVPNVTDTGVDVFVPDCAAQAEATSGRGVTFDASGNDGDDGRDATSTGDNGDDSNS